MGDRMAQKTGWLRKLMRFPTVVVFAPIAAVAISSSPLAASLDRFVFNGERAVNVRNQNEFVQIGEKLPIIELKRRFRRYKIVSTAGEDCSICATISNRSSSIYVDYDGDGIVIVGIRSLDKTSIDFGQCCWLLRQGRYPCSNHGLRCGRRHGLLFAATRQAFLCC